VRGDAERGGAAAGDGGERCADVERAHRRLGYRRESRGCKARKRPRRVPPAPHSEIICVSTALEACAPPCPKISSAKLS
jgi:hypothetical protein